MSIVRISRRTASCLAMVLVLVSMSATATGATPAPSPDRGQPARSQPAAVAPMPAVLADSDTVQAGEFSLRFKAVLAASAPDGSQIEAVELHPGAQVYLAAEITTTGDVASHSRMTFNFPGDGSLEGVEFTPGQNLSAVCPRVRSSVQLGCDVEVDPGEARLVTAVATVSKDAPRRVCVSASILSGDRSTHATSEDVCIATSPWPGKVHEPGFGMGALAPDLSLLDETGTRRSLWDYRGGYVVLTLSAVWCAPSLSETPQDRDEIAALGDELGAPIHQLIVLIDGVDPGVQSTTAQAAKYRGRFGLPDHVLATEGDTNLEARQLHHGFSSLHGGEPAYPTTVFLTPEGRVFGWRAGAGDVGETTSMLRSHPPSPKPVLRQPPRIVGTPSTTRPLRGTRGTWEGADHFGSQWLRCAANGSGCSPIPGATSSTYVPVAADRGRRLMYRITAYRRETGATAQAVVGPPRASRLVIAGSRRVGQKLHARATFTGAISVRYIWTRGGKTIAGARSASYRLTGADKGRTISVSAVASNALGDAQVRARGIKIRP